MRGRVGLRFPLHFLEDSPALESAFLPPLPTRLWRSTHHQRRFAQPPHPDSAGLVHSSAPVGSYHFHRSRRRRPRSASSLGPPRPARYRQTFSELHISSRARLRPWAGDDLVVFH